MTNRCVLVAVVAGLAAAYPMAVAAQQSPWPAPPPSAATAPWPDAPQIMREEPKQQAPRARTSQPRAQRPLRATPEQPDLDEEDQLSPRQLGQPSHRGQPATRAQQAQPPQAAVPADQREGVRAQPPARERAASAARAAVPSAAVGRTTLACGGVFSKDSSHLKLAMRYDSKNVTFAEVDGPEGSKLMASILFPNDPKRRIEVLWENVGQRSGTQLIAINGKSTWTAPKGLKLGMTLAALEKANGRPFRVAGFGTGNTARVVDWQGGALANLPGGCKVGIYLAADANTPAEARGELPADKEFQSSDVAMRAVKPVIGEILLGY
jgi:hypothetical protein